MPFFYLDIDVKGFSRRVYKEIIKSLERIHIKTINWDALLREMEWEISRDE
jgi:hypothetical protein